MSKESKKTFIKKPLDDKVTDTDQLKPSAPFFKFQDKRMTMVISKGELYGGIISFFNEIGLGIPERRDRNFKIQAENLPVTIVPTRTTDIPSTVVDERSNAKAGITGSDIIWEKSYELGTDKEKGETLPLKELIENPPVSTLYTGITDRYKNYIIDKFERDPETRDLNRQTIVTIYPNITREYLKTRGIQETEIFVASGQDEAFQYTYPFEGILGIKSSGKTIKDNRIYVLDEFYSVAVTLITSDFDKLTTRDLQILNDLREMTYLALKKRGVV